VALRSSRLLFPTASGEYGAVHLYVAALHVSRTVERRNYMARDEVSAGGVAEGDGVSTEQFQSCRLKENLSYAKLSDWGGVCRK